MEATVAISRFLPFTCEALAILAVVLQFVLPSNVDLSVSLRADTHVGIPVRSVVPLVVIAVAGFLSTVTLVSAMFALTHHQH
jgi:hypothetical protein